MRFNFEALLLYNLEHRRNYRFPRNNCSGQNALEVVLTEGKK